jgi:hypothetical protein
MVPALLAPTITIVQRLAIARVLLALGRLQLVLERLVVDAQVVVVARGGDDQPKARLRLDAEQLAVGNTDHVGGLLKGKSRQEAEPTAAVT